MKKSIFNRILSWLLIMAIIMQCIPEGVYAAEGETSSTDYVTPEFTVDGSTLTGSELKVQLTSYGIKLWKNVNGGFLYLLYNTGSTSKTTFRINGTNYTGIGGNRVSDAEKGFIGYEKIIDNGKINCSVNQYYSIIENNLTDKKDIVELRYVITNNDTKPVNVGCRIMLDTMVGGNDHSTFRIPGIGQVSKEMEFRVACKPACFLKCW